MEQEFLESRMADLARSVLSYCMARTSCQQDAEDLAQDILLELVKSVSNLRDDAAFYGFMWATAGHIYSSWYRKKQRLNETELTELLPDDHAQVAEPVESEESLFLLRRELSLLSAYYRRAMVYYYVDHKTCAQIASLLHTSEGMVKQLLFKARKILKEGMEMTREYGIQSYQPKSLVLLYMGEGPNRFWPLLDGKRIRQNILWACYNDALTEEEISLQLGVALPYMEEEFQPLLDAGMLIKQGRKYSTGLLIISREVRDEIQRKTASQVRAIANTVSSFIDQNEACIRQIGYQGHDAQRNSFRWQTACRIFRLATDLLEIGEAPVTTFGERAFVWGAEEPAASFSYCTLPLPEGKLFFMDWPSAPGGNHHDFYGNPKISALFGRIAAGNFISQNSFEDELLAQLIKSGYVVQHPEGYRVTCAVYTAAEYHELCGILAPAAAAVSEQAAAAYGSIYRILQDSAPAHVQPMVSSISRLCLIHTAADEPAALLCADGYLLSWKKADEMPTMSLVLE